MLRPAVLGLATGDVFRGVAIGASGSSVGEVVFNTAMTGYQEICSDPSYRQQMVTLTYPHVGNVGANPEDQESAIAQVAGLIIRERPRTPSNWRSAETLPAYLERLGVVGIAEIDTRRLTRILRDQGAQSGCIVTDTDDADLAVERARAFSGLAGLDLAQEVTTDEVFQWAEPSWGQATPEPKHHVVVMDYGVKRNILRRLVDVGCRVTVVPAKTSLEDVLAHQPDGVMLSNGPGDPEPCDYAVAIARQLMEQRVPVMGICLGHQILGLACGGRTTKMKFGHHGANHPVRDERSGQVMITSQNHGFAVDEASLPETVRVTHRSLFDGTLQGIERTDVPAFSFQGHPEASPGPHDLAPLFEHFSALMAANPR
ncbi:glutamine-hydrolyzing carbamoyl-phosphate synthase small subunit [Abyssibacter profundi]|uniref:glutamine-hydrolyzing carbamoyl-phosphate synthase small subunit n=1 Tax=Abyssibacter profundi TaxID=2182787 RepID=UPI001A9C29F7|nr:glutamine-hydrolyzing carbamoyl-phosphate synthase small subunit [Abyssibacter profundi]